MQRITLEEARQRAAAYADSLVQKLEEANRKFPDCPPPRTQPHEKRAAFYENHLRFLEKHYEIMS
jgi:hypothetical protein